MKQLYCLYFLLNALSFTPPVYAQDPALIAALKNKIRLLEKQQQYFSDTVYLKTITDLGYIYSYSYPDSALALLKETAAYCRKAGYEKGESNTYIITGDAYQTKGLYKEALENFEKSLKLTKKNKWTNTLPLVLNRIGIVYLNQGNYSEALGKFYESLKTAEVIGKKELIGATLNNIAIVHYHQGNFADAESDYRKRLVLAEETGDSSSISLAYNGIGEAKLQQKDLPAALRNLAIAHAIALQISDQDMQLTTALSLGEVYYASDSLQKAISLFENALSLSKTKDNGTIICNALVNLAKARHKQGLFQEALANGLEAWQRATTMGQVQIKRDASEVLASIYESMGDGKTALQFYRWFKVNSDSLNNLASQRAVANEKAGYEFAKKEAVFQRKTSQQRWLIFTAFAGLVSLAVIAWIIGRSRRRLNRTYKELQYKNVLIETQKATAEETLGKLKATQAQLIQAEKMASLGELTAGIAHEIQNPLNFVNNFSEVNIELLVEMNEEMERGNVEEAKMIAKDVMNNEEKINQHGKRADAIVKGMLQHSRSSTGQKEPTDINLLADECLNLAYHGIRAKDKSLTAGHAGFTATLKTDFDESIGKININPQDIGRAILNLSTNAFYAVNEKNLSAIAGSDDEKYKPTVSISTRKLQNKVEIIVADNGNGIPAGIIDKIFQPFFTTKPTGLGTGLGLSLVYDIVRAHGGEIKVKVIPVHDAAAAENKAEGTEFIITLPI